MKQRYIELKVNNLRLALNVEVVAEVMDWPPEEVAADQYEVCGQYKWRDQIASIHDLRQCFATTKGEQGAQAACVCYDEQNQPVVLLIDEIAKLHNVDNEEFFGLRQNCSGEIREWLDAVYCDGEGQQLLRLKTPIKMH